VQETTAPATPPPATPPGGAGRRPRSTGVALAGLSAGRPITALARRPLAGRVAAAVLGGILLFLAFPPIDLWFLAPVGIAAGVLAVRGCRPRRGAWLGYLFGAAFLLPSFAWVRPIGDDAWIALSLVESLFYAALGAGVAVVTRLRGGPLWAAALWVAMEWARSEFPVGGFPWARVAFSQGESAFTAYAALGGVPLVTFAVALCGTLLALLCARIVAGPAVRRRAGDGDARDASGTAQEEAETGAADAVAGDAGPGTAEGTRPGTARGATGGERARDRGWDRGWTALVVPPLAGALAVPALAAAVPRPGDEGRTVNVGVVQGNVPGRGMHVFGDEPAVVLRNHTGGTRELARAVREGRLPAPDLVVLPENATDIDPYRSEFAYRELDGATREVGVPVLVGAVVAVGAEHRATRSLVWDPVTGPGAYYDKQKLVPFGEFTPFKDVVLALFERAGLVGRQSVPGTRDGDLRMGPVTIGAVNCYEVAFDGVVRGTVRAGGSPLVVQTNNATYALTNLPPQQLAMSKLRAVEHNRAVITAATTGISAYVTPDGTVAWRTQELVADMNVVTVPVRTATTVATRVGAAPERALALVAVGAVAVGLWRGRRGAGPRKEQAGEE
jgi:apolipoprotein N-acyltransferase